MLRTVAVLLIVTLVLGTVLIAGCGGGGTDGPVMGSFTCKVDGVTFTGNFRWCREKDGRLQIWGVRSDEVPYIELSLALPVTAPVTLNLVNPGVGNWAMWDSNSDTIGTEFYSHGAGAGSGTVTVTSYDGNRCVGTFAFVAQNAGATATVNITEGVFDVYTAAGLSGW